MQSLYCETQRIQMAFTDATGNIFFPRAFEMAINVLENFLFVKNFSLKKLLDDELVFPVVHASADYCKPLKYAEEITIFLSVKNIGTKSIAFRYEFKNIISQIKHIEMTIVHATVNKAGNYGVPIPDFLKAIFINSA